MKRDSFNQHEEEKMKCSNVQRLLSPYMDDELTAAKKRELENHLEGCERCRKEKAEIQRVRELFTKAEDFKAPHGFRTRVMAHAGKTSGVRRRWGIPLPVRVAETVAVLLLIVVGIGSGSLLAKGLMPERAGQEIASLSLDVFNPVPPGSLGGAYLAVTEDRDEK